MTAVRALCSNLVIRCISRMTSTYTYEDAVQKLNTLQSNKTTIDQIRKNIRNGQLSCTNLEDMENYLQRTGVTLATLDKLSVIHVAGTKGKGSTSAMCESILRHHGYKTGFFSSPHLVSVCERIRLDGQIISKDKFSQYFHHVYDLLDSTKEFEGDMPKYFAFLTVLAFNIFLKEKVDVAIVEVGIGGTVDYTNILRKVPVVGISSLGLDHTSILGNTIEEIAQAKAGIMKPQCEAYTVTQPPAAMEVLKKVAREVKSELHIVPEYHTYVFPKEYKDKLHVDLDAYYMNASLAIQLAHSWMKLDKLQNQFNMGNIVNKHAINGKILRNIDDNMEIDSFINEKHKNGNNVTAKETTVTSVSVETVQGLRNCRWPGRYQKIKADYAQFYLDGAHTKESMEICVDWFKNNTCDRNIDKILLFSATGDRNSEVLLFPLENVNFKKVIFVVPRAYTSVTQKNDNYSVMEEKELLERCNRHVDIWENLPKTINSSSLVLVEECVSDALVHVKQSNYSHVLITGSLHLVGAALSILDQNLTS